MDTSTNFNKNLRSKVQYSYDEWEGSKKDKRDKSNKPPRGSSNKRNWG